MALTVISVRAEMTANAVKSQVAGNVVFTDELRTMLPPVVADFVEKYLYERVFLDKNEEETRRRMAFDEVSCSFPLKEASINQLQNADGLSVLLEQGKKYTITWSSDGENIGEISFPASFNLLLFTNQVESYKDLVSRLNYRANNKSGVKINYVRHRSDSVSSAYRRNGTSFYLGHLESHTYHDSISGRPIWTREFPAESLANLFVFEKPVAEVTAIVEVLAYNGDKTSIHIPVQQLRELLEEMGCDPYFGVSEVKEETGEIDALVVYHNPDLQYLHKLEVKADPSKVWQEDGVAMITIKLTPYIKLHNLKNLWGEKK